MVRYKSPFGPPFSPGSPSPRNTIVWLSSTPAGILTDNLTWLRTVPFPLQVSQASLMIFPVPWQLVQVLMVCICPKIVVCTCFIWPLPWQTLQVSGCVPGLLPSPWQVWQVSLRLIVTYLSVPKKDSSKLISKSYCKSVPFLGPFCLVPPRLPPKPPPKKEEKISPKSPKSLNPSKPVEYV